MQQSCDDSMKRLQADVLDRYLMHWRGGNNLHEVVSGFEKLKSQGKIKAWGVSNFDTGDMQY